MTSRERMLVAIGGGRPDYTPCAFMIFANLMKRSTSRADFVERQVALGLDAPVHVGYLRPSMHPAAQERVWIERTDGQTVYCRRIDTPKGPLTQRVAQWNGWPTDESFWPFNDYVVPRACEVLVKPETDLAKLPYLLGPFRDEDINTLRASAREAKAQAARHGLLQVGGWGSSYSIDRDDGVMGADAMGWLSGYTGVMELSLTAPEIIAEYARIIHAWNMRQIQIYLDVTDADLIVRRGWYETTEFWTPAAWRAIILPGLRREAEVVHQAGRRFGYIITSAFLPLLDDILASGIDVLIGLDPEEGKGTDLAAVKSRFRAAKRALWGGVSGALTVEQGSAEDTAAAVRHALAILGSEGFILSPVDNVSDDTPRAWRNTDVFIETWKASRR